MIINNGPIGGKFNPLKDILIKNPNSGSFVNVDIASNDGFCLFEPNGEGWNLTILKTCLIQFKQKVKTDICLIGGGAAGSPGEGSQKGVYGQTGFKFWATGGTGGGGGEVKNIIKKIINKGSYTITIGAGGSNANGGSTLGFSESANGGQLGGGGTGKQNKEGNEGNSGAYPFNDSSYGYKYGACGGGGAAPSQSGLYFSWNNSGGAGGTSGGGAGGSATTVGGSEGKDGTKFGAGGGGGAVNSQLGSTTPGEGYQGAIIIRNNNK